MNLKKIKLWCESLPAEAEVRPIVLGLVAELEEAKEEIQGLESALRGAKRVIDCAQRINYERDNANV